jgi:hypothetical protein
MTTVDDDDDDDINGAVLLGCLLAPARVLICEGREKAVEKLFGCETNKQRNEMAPLQKRCFGRPCSRIALVILTVVVVR